LRLGTVPGMDLPAAIREAMISHARRCLPEEACGLLAFDGAGALRRAYCLANADHSATGFTVDPDDHFRVLGDAETRGWTVGGVFHSHPVSAATPSRTDIARSLDPTWLHVIVGLVDTDVPDVRGWRITDGEATEEPLVLVPPIASPEEKGGA